MKVFLDTNILFSAILFPGSIPDKALQKALQFPYEAITCDYVIDELRRNIAKKFPQKLDALDRFLVVLATNITIIKVSYDTKDTSLNVRDDNDKPVLRAALQSGSDILITGDKDFLDSEIKIPKIMRAADFYNLP